MYSERVHTVAKGDTLIGIAKKYKHKNWRTIWNAPKNKKLVSKRKKPEKIEPKDKLIIPLNEKERQTYNDTRDKMIEVLTAEMELQAALHERKGFAKAAAKRAHNYHKQTDKLYLEIIADLQDAAKNAKKWGDGVDIAAMLINLTRGLAKLSSLGMKAAKAEGEALAKINAKAQKTAMKMAYKPSARAATKSGSKYLTDPENEFTGIGGALGVVGDSFIKMTSPSFWAWTAVRLYEGDGWSDAVTFDFQRDVKNKIYVIDKNRIFATKKLLLAAQEADKRVKDIEAEIKVAEKRAREVEKELDKWPPLD